VPITNENEEVRLVFQQSTKRTEFATRGAEKTTEKFTTTLTDLAKLFKGFHIDSIELWLEGGAQTGKIVDLFVSAEGKGGCKITLKPEQKTL
jgi:hypothetical protein